MGVNFRNSNSFIVRYTIILTLISTVFISGLLYVIGGFNAAYMLLLTLLLLITNFLVLRIGVDKYVFKLLQHLYSEVSLLEDFELKEGRVSTDLKSLTSDIEEFARGKKIEIETLKIREEYRKDFLGNVAHEMKTPLFTIQGYILTLLDGALQDKKVRKRYLERANKNVDRLLHIVNDLDTITRLESGYEKLNRTVFDIHKLISSVFEMLELKASKKDIKLLFDKSYSEPLWANGDAEKVEQVLINLIENSIKYGDQGGTTEVAIEKFTKHKWIVRITDNGQGISEEHLPRLFERFYRVDRSGSRKQGGSGLGLSIVKHIIEAHGERIYVESTPEIGSEFSFTLQKTENNSSKSTSELKASSPE